MHRKRLTKLSCILGVVLAVSVAGAALRSTLTTTFVTIGVTSTTGAAANTARNYFFVQNTSAVPVWCNFSAVAQRFQGILFAPNSNPSQTWETIVPDGIFTCIANEATIIGITEGIQNP